MRSAPAERRPIPKHQRALLELLPQLTLINGYGSSETGNMGFGHSQRGTQNGHVRRCVRAALVLSEDYGRFLATRRAGGRLGRARRTHPAGLLRRCRRHPQDLSRRRGAARGDLRRPGSLEADGTLRLFGRDSLVVNTGGEKVFVEEVEEVLRAYPGVADALVVGRPSERWGEEIVALVALQPGMDVAVVTADSLHAQCTSQLARFKAPKEFIIVDQVRRLGNGKADYRWAKSHCGATRRH